MALDKITTGIIADDAVTGAKIENNPTVAGNLTVAGTSTLTGNATASGNLTVTGDIVPSAPLSHRNIVINGAMTIAQRGISSTSTGGSGYYHTADRMFNFDNCVAANFTRESTNGVLGTESGNIFKDVFPYSWKFASNGTVSSIPASDRVFFAYKIEGQDVQHLAKGTASAKPITLSFWVKSTQTGNHQVNITDDNSRMIGAVYAVSSANTWEKKVITFAGDTTGGTIDNDNTQGLAIEWWLTAGSTYTSGAVPTSWEANAAGDRAAGAVANYVGGSGRTWQRTGIPLELGSNATPYEHRSYGDELARCQRYYTEHDAGSYVLAYLNPIKGSTGASDEYRRYMFYYPVRMRANPTVTATGDPGSISINNPANKEYAHCAGDQGGDEGTVVNLRTVKANAEL